MIQYESMDSIQSFSPATLTLVNAPCSFHRTCRKTRRRPQSSPVRSPVPQSVPELAGSDDGDAMELCFDLHIHKPGIVSIRTSQDCLGHMGKSDPPMTIAQ